MKTLYTRTAFGADWVSLEYIKRFPNSARTRKWRTKKVRIYSYEHSAYWGPNRSGYYNDGLKAGVYTFDDAYEATNHCGPEKGITYRAV